MRVTLGSFLTKGRAVSALFTGHLEASTLQGSLRQSQLSPAFPPPRPRLWEVCAAALGPSDQPVHQLAAPEWPLSPSPTLVFTYVPDSSLRHRDRTARMTCNRQGA